MLVAAHAPVAAKLEEHTQFVVRSNTHGPVAVPSRGGCSGGEGGEGGSGGEGGEGGGEGGGGGGGRGGGKGGKGGGREGGAFVSFTLKVGSATANPCTAAPEATIACEMLAASTMAAAAMTASCESLTAS